MPPLKITVVTVTYNAGDLISRTIHSVEEQTYPYVEHLIVDGNSQDNTLEHVHHYQERNSVLPFVMKSNASANPMKVSMMP